jgi:hypothetical protein
VEIIILALRTARWSPMTSKVPFVKFTRAATRLEMDFMSAATRPQRQRQRQGGQCRLLHMHGIGRAT